MNIVNKKLNASVKFSDLNLAEKEGWVAGTPMDIWT